MLEDVRAFPTRSGNARYVAGRHRRQYTTFREAIGEQRRSSRAPGRLTHREEQRADYASFYLHRLEPLENHTGTGTGTGDADDEEAAWRTAEEAPPGRGAR